MFGGSSVYIHPLAYLSHRASRNKDDSSLTFECSLFLFGACHVLCLSGGAPTLLFYLLLEELNRSFSVFSVFRCL